MFLMSQHMKRASEVEVVVLNSNFDVVRSVVIVLTSSGCLMRFLPTVMRV